MPDLRLKTPKLLMVQFSMGNLVFKIESMVKDRMDRISQSRSDRISDCMVPYALLRKSPSQQDMSRIV